MQKLIKDSKKNRKPLIISEEKKRSRIKGRKLSRDYCKEITEKAKKIFSEINNLKFEEKVKTINLLRIEINKLSPFKYEPTDCVLWIHNSLIQANDYNPNIVAPPEMELLKVSIERDGFTQPIVSWKNDNYYEVVDGFHRNKVGREYDKVNKRIKDYLPITIINSKRGDRGDRISSTIRHNRARGKHTVEGMSDIIIELKNRNWTNDRIARSLGMDEDEILRLCQITGLASLFSNKEFSKSWDIEDSEEDFIPLSDELDVIEPVAEENKFRVVNTSDENRIFHTHDKWECHKAGFYATTKDGMTTEQCEEEYRKFLADKKKFKRALQFIITHWKFSCEHYLTNTAMNRIAWLGQASACHAIKIPARYRGGFYLLTEKQQKEANEIALLYLNKWLKANNMEKVTMEEGLALNKQVDLY